MRLAGSGDQAISLGNWLSPTLDSDFLSIGFILFVLFWRGEQSVGSPVYILKALRLNSCDWINLGHTFIPEQVHTQGLKYIENTVLPGPLTPGSLINPTQTTWTDSG